MRNSCNLQARKLSQSQLNRMCRSRTSRTFRSRTTRSTTEYSKSRACADFLPYNLTSPTPFATLDIKLDKCREKNPKVCFDIFKKSLFFFLT